LPAALRPNVGHRRSLGCTANVAGCPDRGTNHGRIQGLLMGTLVRGVARNSFWVGIIFTAPYCSPLYTSNLTTSAAISAQNNLQGLILGGYIYRYTPVATPLTLVGRRLGRHCCEHGCPTRVTFWTLVDATRVHGPCSRPRLVTRAASQLFCE